MTTAPADRHITWNGVTLAVPAAFTDQSVLTFVDQPERPQASITVSQEPLAGGKPALLRYVGDQLAAIQRAAPRFVVTRQSERPHPAGPAVHVEAAAAANAQHQLYLLDEGAGRVVVCTVTGGPDAARALFDDVVASLEVNRG